MPRFNIGDTVQIVACNEHVPHDFRMNCHYIIDDIQKDLDGNTLYMLCEYDFCEGKYFTQGVYIDEILLIK